MKSEIILQKGESIEFLDYTIKNSLNSDGIVLMKPKGKRHECHLGNFGEGAEENVDTCKRYAIMHFMVARPATFCKTIVNKMMRLNSGTMHEYFLLQRACKDESIILPEEITAGDDANLMIYFKGKPLAPENK